MSDREADRFPPRRLHTAAHLDSEYELSADERKQLAACETAYVDGAAVPLYRLQSESEIEWIGRVEKYLRGARK